MTTAAIRDTIEMAKRQEQKSGNLAGLFAKYIQNRIHLAIRLPAEGGVDCLVGFVTSYVEHVPQLLDAANAITKEAKIEEYSQPFLQLAEDFFLKPPEILAEHVGLEELMDEAYLAHRLMEEINDHFMLRASIPLIPVNMTISNLIVHSLIGEPFANELDEAVYYTMNIAMKKDYVYESKAFKNYASAHKNNQWKKEKQHWPCLTDSLSINLHFSEC